MEGLTGTDQPLMPVKSKGAGMHVLRVKESLEWSLIWRFDCMLLLLLAACRMCVLFRTWQEQQLHVGACLTFWLAA